MAQDPGTNMLLVMLEYAEIYRKKQVAGLLADAFLSELDEELAVKGLIVSDSDGKQRSFGDQAVEGLEASDGGVNSASARFSQLTTEATPSSSAPRFTFRMPLSQPAQSVVQQAWPPSYGQQHASTGYQQDLSFSYQNQPSLPYQPFQRNAGFQKDMGTNPVNAWQRPGPASFAAKPSLFTHHAWNPTKTPYTLPPYTVPSSSTPVKSSHLIHAALPLSFPQAPPLAGGSQSSVAFPPSRSVPLAQSATAAQCGMDVTTHHMPPARQMMVAAAPTDAVALSSQRNESAHLPDRNVSDSSHKSGAAWRPTNVAPQLHHAKDTAELVVSVEPLRKKPKLHSAEAQAQYEQLERLTKKTQALVTANLQSVLKAPSKGKGVPRSGVNDATKHVGTSPKSIVLSSTVMPHTANSHGYEGEMSTIPKKAEGSRKRKAKNMTGDANGVHACQSHEVDAKPRPSVGQFALSSLTTTSAASQIASGRQSVDTKVSTHSGREFAKPNKNERDKALVDLLCPKDQKYSGKTERKKNNSRINRIVTRLAQRIITYPSLAQKQDGCNKKEKSQSKHIVVPLILCGTTSDKKQRIDFTRNSVGPDSIRSRLKYVNATKPQNLVRAEWEKLLHNVVQWNPMLYPELTLSNAVDPSPSVAVTNSSQRNIVHSLGSYSAKINEEHISAQKKQHIPGRASAMFSQEREVEAEKLNGMLDGNTSDEAGRIQEPQLSNPIKATLAILAATDQPTLAVHELDTPDIVYAAVGDV
ncbi:hypothetical protein LTR08_007891 [Meristemomyces frigidus]|nr:hypothetical protein LTR08_007891 [Meristemomyces frigidus]